MLVCISYFVYRKKGNDQESIQLTSLRHQRERRTHLKQCMQRHTITKIVNHSRSSALERSVKPYWGGEGGVLNRFYVTTTLVLSSVVIYTRHLFSPKEGVFTQQCIISKNIKIKRIQRWNNDKDSTVRNNWNAEAKENQQVDSGGPDQSQSIRHQPTYLYVVTIFDD